ncbi:hypothetical protein C9439_07995 [archaeon SCG-AAA382B04]|nr:hypothetical protein C9439_07995 [archaeon SCG-AAA382B04]
MAKKDEWKRGVAFVRGINMFDNAKITKEKMRELCEKIEDKDLKVKRIHRTDNVVFKKRNMHYATVGQRLEKVLEKHFDKKMHVTCRSMRTVKGLTRN